MRGLYENACDLGVGSEFYKCCDWLIVHSHLKHALEISNHTCMYYVLEEKYVYKLKVTGNMAFHLECNAFRWMQHDIYSIQYVYE